MNKALLALASTILAGAVTAPAVAGEQEIGYKSGALGTSAIMAGDYRQAEAQLNRLDGVSENDPARLINLGQVYARTGRYQEAIAAFRAAQQAPSFDIILSDGKVIDSRTAATYALRSAERKMYASR